MPIRIWTRVRRTATEDTELDGHQIKKGDRLVLWYISGNRDESVFPDGDAIIVDRENARRHLSFGYGIHRCVGSHLARLELRVARRQLRHGPGCTLGLEQLRKGTRRRVACEETNPLAIRRKRARPNRAAMTAKRRQTLAGRCIPDADRVVARTRDDAAAIASNRHRLDGDLVILDRKSVV